MSNFAFSYIFVTSGKYLDINMYTSKYFHIFELTSLRNSLMFSIQVNVWNHFRFYNFLAITFTSCLQWVIMDKWRNDVQLSTTHITWHQWYMCTTTYVTSAPQNKCISHHMKGSKKCGVLAMSRHNYKTYPWSSEITTAFFDPFIWWLMHRQTDIQIDTSIIIC